MKFIRLTLAAPAAALALGSFAAAPASAQMMNDKPVTVCGAPMYASKTIVQNAVNSKDHTTLVAAVKAAGLVDTLSGPDPFTCSRRQTAPSRSCRKARSTRCSSRRTSRSSPRC